MRFCPVCKEVLINTLREDVEIDYCPKCRGVWLDRNELDKIIERVTRRLKAQVAQKPESEMPMPVDLHRPEHFPIQRYPAPHFPLDPSYMEEIFDFDD